MAVFVGATCIGPVTGGALNPAIGLSPNVMNVLFGQGELGNVWVYLIGPTLGAAIAAFVFNILNPDDRMADGESVREFDRGATVSNE
jgi:aquaporin Z